MVSSKFRRFLLNVSKKRSADIGIGRDHHLMLAYMRLAFASATSRRRGVAEALHHCFSPHDIWLLSATYEYEMSLQIEEKLPQRTKHSNAVKLLGMTVSPQSYYPCTCSYCRSAVSTHTEILKIRDFLREWKKETIVGIYSVDKPGMLKRTSRTLDR